MHLNPLQQMRLARLFRQKAQHASLSDRHRLLNHAAVFEALARAQASNPKFSPIAQRMKAATCE